MMIDPHGADDPEQLTLVPIPDYSVELVTEEGLDELRAALQRVFNPDNRPGLTLGDLGALYGNLSLSHKGLAPMQRHPWLLTKKQAAKLVRCLNSLDSVELNSPIISAYRIKTHGFEAAAEIGACEQLLVEWIESSD